VVLNSWKEIAGYLGRGVRTVQRWERHLGLPVHRPKGKNRSAVLAFPSELDNWLRNTPLRENVEGCTLKPAASGASPQPANGKPPFRIEQVRESCARSKQLMLAVSEAARRHHALAAEVCASLRQISEAKYAAGVRKRYVAAPISRSLETTIDLGRADAAAASSSGADGD
jgi:hypothetical protein